MTTTETLQATLDRLLVLHAEAVEKLSYNLDGEGFDWGGRAMDLLRQITEIKKVIEGSEVVSFEQVGYSPGSIFLP